MIETRGETFVLVERREDLAALTDTGPTLTDDEVAHLAVGRPLSEAFVRVIAEIKRVFSGAWIKSARRLSR